MDNKDESAFPRENNLYSRGLSKLEYASIMAMQGLLSRNDHWSATNNRKTLAEASIEIAETLLDHLSNTQGK